MKNKIKHICTTALGVALYFVASLSIKIPVISHISLDLGYIVLGVYCYRYGVVSGAIVGAFGCAAISLLTSGWFPPGWFVGNIAIGLICGFFYKKDRIFRDIIVSVIAVFIGIFCIKTAIECVMFGIPLAAKIPSNGIAAIMDAVVMSLSIPIAVKLSKRLDQGGSENAD